MTKNKENSSPSKEQKEENKIKTSFVIMPIADSASYEPRHFSRVYEHLIKPAVEQAGFKVDRADQSNKTDVILVEIIKSILNADIIICDLSNKNPNVMYELGIAHSFDKKIVLIKDEKTKRIFDVSGIRDFEYNSNLRVDLVENYINGLCDRIINTYKDDNSSSMLTLLSIKQIAVLPKSTELNPDTALILSSIKKQFDYLNDEIHYLKQFSFNSDSILSKYINSNKNMQKRLSRMNLYKIINSMPLSDFLNNFRDEMFLSLINNESQNLTFYEYNEGLLFFRDLQGRIISINQDEKKTLEQLIYLG